MNWESAVLREVEYCLSHYRLYVVPRDARPCLTPEQSVWTLCDPRIYAGIVWRNNTGAVRVGRRMVRFGVVGSPDFTGWIFGMGRNFSVEVKSEQSKGRLSHDQKARHGLALATGAYSAVVRSYEECEEFCRFIGLTRGTPRIMEGS